MSQSRQLVLMLNDCPIGIYTDMSTLEKERDAHRKQMEQSHSTNRLYYYHREFVVNNPARF